MRDDFSSMKPPVSVATDRDRLFDLVRAATTPAMLGVISRCDYGSDEAAHLEGLERICDGVDLDTPIGWEPNEVLTLYRWNDTSSQRDFANLRDFHIARAFCCCALLRVPDKNENRSLYSNESIAPLVESVTFLGEPFHSALASYLVWMLEQVDPWDENFLFVAFALVLVVGGTEVEEWFVRVHAEVLTWHDATMCSGLQTMLDLPYVTISASLWKKLAAQKVASSGPAQDLIALIAKPTSLPQKVRRATSWLRRTF